MLKIPKIFHQIWLGPNPLPKEFEKYQKTWQKIHSDWELKFWTEENLPPTLVRDEINDRLRSPVERSDLLRLEVVNIFGGIYFDTDFECLRSIEPLLENVDVFLAYLDDRRTNNAIIGAIPDHPFIIHVIKEAKPREFYGYDKAAAGPLHVDKLVKKNSGITLFPSHLFYPNTPLEREKAVAIHHASRTWRVDDGFKASALNAERRLLAAQQKFVEVGRELHQIQMLQNKAEILNRLEKIRLSISEYLAEPTKARLETNRWWRIKRIAKKIIGRAKRVYKLFQKIVWRRVHRLYNTRYRNTYAKRLDRIPDREEIPFLLNRRELFGLGIEVGVQRGRFSDYLLEHWKGKQLISVDPWLEDSLEKYVDHANVPQDKHDVLYLETKQRLSKHGDRSLVWRMNSLEAAEKIDDQSLDFVYIDARHDYVSVQEDLNLWFQKIAPGGIIAGHDYADTIHRGAVFGVKSAVDDFFAEKGLPVYVTEGKWPVEMFPSWIVEIPENNHGQGN